MVDALEMIAALAMISSMTDAETIACTIQRLIISNINLSHDSLPYSCLQLLRPQANRVAEHGGDLAYD
jgi:hypothetical protein